ncbi:SIR2 family protein [Herbaspirillum frisingense]|uniref:SIR2 family protein n=1 Tax=Herbaspirillum frisingense TaxID=92645 RepID=UPI001F222528|nr:SIR2 family protein [Herbaspirillum frisingense]UIN22398.1 SIR2 family protein [Herbaspirillum frisingense]
MSELGIYRLSDDSGRTFLRGLLATGRCIPFIGAGFTAGESARQGEVPSGEEFTELMRSALLKSPVENKPSDQSLKDYGFQELADEYFREEIVDVKEIKETLNALFTKVRISSEAKRSFLRWQWDYLYTLNIDDAIEHELDAIKVLPYKNFARHESRQFVYKLHGDATDAVTAGSRVEIPVIFGTADYVQSLVSNQALLSAFRNDLAERHFLFVGCSLSDELAILFTLAGIKISGSDISANKRVFVTSSLPENYEQKKKLRKYGITDVLVVDYADFYAFIGSTPFPSSAKGSPLEQYSYSQKNHGVPADLQYPFLRYLLQIAWSGHYDSHNVAINRSNLTSLEESINEPIVVVWGRRFSGRTSVLHSILHKFQNRRRFFIPTSASASDALISDICRVKDSLVVLDSDAAQISHLHRLIKSAEDIRENKSTVVIASSRSLLTNFSSSSLAANFECVEKMNPAEAAAINHRLEEYGFSKGWELGKKHLENLFSISESPVVKGLFKEKSKLFNNVERLATNWRDSNVGRFELSLLFYLATRQRIYSRYYRTLAKEHGLAHVSSTHFDDFAINWAPFVEIEDSDRESNKSENSTRVMLCNANAWVLTVMRRLTAKIGAIESASMVVRTFRAMSAIDDRAFELLMFDSLNAIFPDTETVRGAAIRQIYKDLAPQLASDADYWLQRAKSIYYLSKDEYELRMGVEYCQKSIVKRYRKTSTNAKLTRANLLGKICRIKTVLEDVDVIEAIDAYTEAIASRSENPLYIDDLLRKSDSGKSYMNFVCNAASDRPVLLLKRHEVNAIRAYIKGI